MLIIINIITIAIALFFIRYPRSKNILHPKKTFLAFFLIVQVSGFFLIELIKIIDQEYKISDDSLIAISWITLAALIAFIFFYYLLNPLQAIIFKHVKLPKLKSENFRGFTVIFLIIGILGLLIYYLNNGFTLLKPGGYENKNLANVGLGYARIMYGYGFTFALSSFLAINYSKKKFKLSIIGSIILGALIFIIIGGGRASALNLLILTLVIHIYFNPIKVKKMILLGIIFSVLIFSLTVIRYKLSFSSDNIVLFLYQFQGSFSPVDSFARIYENIPKNHDFNPSLALNSFLTLIPRSIWINKPLEIEVASVFFTNDILNYKSFLTISPTLLGELYIYHGLTGIFIGMFACAFLVKILSVIYLKANRSTNMKIFIILNALYAFSLFREGISISLRNFFFFILIFSIMAFVLQVLSLSFNKANR